MLESPLSPRASGGGCRLLTLFCLLCVVAVRVETRGSDSAPAEAEGWMVVRRVLLRLVLRESPPGLEVESADCCCELPLTMFASSPGPTDFLGCFAAAAAVGPVGTGPAGTADEAT